MSHTGSSLPMTILLREELVAVKAMIQHVAVKRFEKALNVTVDQCLDGHAWQLRGHSI